MLESTGVLRKSVEDGLLFKSDGIVVPRSLRAEVLDGKKQEP